MPENRAKINVIVEQEELQLVVCRIEGSITGHTLSEIEGPEKVFGAETFTKKLLLNLTKCEHLDSTGVAWLLQLHRFCNNSKGRLVIHSVTPAILRTLTMLNMQTVLHIVDDEQAARSD